MTDFSTNPVTSTAAVEYLVGKTIDTILSYSPITLFFLGNQKTWKGTQMRIPIKHSISNEGTNFDGLEKFSTIRADRFVNMTFNPTGREEPVVVSQMEVDVADKTKVIDLVARELSASAQDMAHRIGNLFYTLQSGKAFLSLLDIIDDGTNASSIGGQSKTTYTGLAANYTASIGNLTLATMRTSFNNSMHGANGPKLIVADKTAWAYYEKLLTPTLNNQVNSVISAGYPKFTGASPNGLPNIVAAGTNLQGAQGFSAITYSGIPVVADELCPSGNMFMINTDAIAFYGVASTDPDYKSVKFASDTLSSVYNVPVTTGFNFSGFNKPIDQYGKVGHILLMGNLVPDGDLRTHARLLGITGA
jgi:hypothetical protein